MSLLPVVSSTLSLPRPRSVREQRLSALDALEAAEVPAFLQTGSDTSQLLFEGAGQPREQRLHLAGVDLQRRRNDESTRAQRQNHT